MLPFSSFDAKPSSDSNLNLFCDRLKQEAAPPKMRVTHDEESFSFPIHSAEANLFIHDSETLTDLVFRLLERFERNESFHFPILENGSVVAAGIKKEEGEYGKAIWLRDLGRVFEGLLADGQNAQASQVAIAILNSLSSPIQLKAFYELIQNPKIYSEEGVVRLCPRIRLDAWTQEPIVLADGSEHEWEHLQHDALAISFFAIAHALEKKLVRFEQLPANQQKVLYLIPAYFIAIEAWNQKDSGAWEEWRAKRSSSIGLVTQCLEKYQSLRSSPLLPRRLETIFEETERMAGIEALLQPQSLSRALEKARSSLQQLEKGEAPHERQSPEKRFYDGALAHLLWYPSSSIGEKEKSWICSHLKKIERECGILRYDSDIYMQAFFYFQKREGDDPLRTDFFHSSQSISQSDLWNLYNPRNPELAFRYFGAQTEPQWCLHDPILARSHLQDFLINENLESKASFLHHFFRCIGQLTKENALAADGSMVKAFTLPEAYIPYIHKNIKTKVYLPSKNTPLFWALSELRVLLKEIEQNQSQLQIKIRSESEAF